MSNANYISYFRKKLKLSQQKLANNTNLSRHYISLLERGIHNPSLYDAIKIAKALDLPLPDIFFEIFYNAIMEVNNNE